MIEVKIPNNIAEYKPKFMLGLSGRRFTCLLLTAVAILLDFKFLKPVIGDFAVVLAAVPAFIATLFGWVEPYGMPFENYLKSVLFQAVLAPKVRRTRTAVSSFVIPCDKYYVPIPDSAVSAEVMACVTEVREKLGIVVEEGPVNGPARRKKKAPVKPKYRKSKQAYL